MSVLDFSIAPHAAVKAAPKVVGVKPFGSKLLVELLGSQELTSGKIIVADGVTTDGPPQAYVLEVGPGIQCPHIQALKGKRVILNGTGVNVPVFEEGRVKLLVEYNTVQGIIEEESVACCQSNKTESGHSCCRS